jgi:hypothetical protein
LRSLQAGPTGWRRLGNRPARTGRASAPRPRAGGWAVEQAESEGGKGPGAGARPRQGRKAAGPRGARGGAAAGWAAEPGWAARRGGEEGRGEKEEVSFLF